MIETVCAKFRKQNHPNNTLLLTWAAFLSHFRPILHDVIYMMYKYILLAISGTQLVVFVASLLEVLPVALRGGTRRRLEGGRELRAASAPSQKQNSSVAAAEVGDGSVPPPATMSGRRGFYCYWAAL